MAIKNFFASRRFWGIVGSLAVIAIVALAYFYPDAMQGNVLRQADMQQGMAIGQETKAWEEATGEHSRWTNSLFSGMPTFQISPSYPSDRLFTWIGTVMGLGLPSPANLLVMMMVGFFILLLAMKLRWYVALIGALAYGFSSYFIIIIGAGHIWKFVTLAYIPPTIAGVVLAYRGKYLWGGALAGLFAMMQIAGNHAQMSYYFLFVVLGFAMAYMTTAIRNGKMKQWWIASAVLVVAGGLAVTANLPSLYNTYEYSKETIRGGHSELSHEADPANTTDGLDRSYITQYSYGQTETLSLMIPNIKGGASVKPEKGQHNILGLGDLPEAQKMVASGQLSPQEGQFLGYMSQYFGEPEGTNGPVYVGALIVALFLVGCVIVRGPMKWVLVALTLFSILLALGRNCMWLTDLMIDYMPMYSKFRTVESILVIAEFTMPLLGAMALQKLLITQDAWSQFKKPLIWCFGIAGGICLLALMVPGIFGDVITDSDRYIANQIAAVLQQQGANAQMISYLSLDNPRIYAAIESLRHSMIQADALRSFIIMALGFGLLMLYYNQKLSLGVTAILIAGVICGDLYLVNKRYLDSDSFVQKALTTGEPFPMTQADRQILADTTMHYRVMNIPQFNLAAPSYRHKAIGGYHAAKLTRYQDMIDRHLSAFLYGAPDSTDMNVINMLNARYIVTDDQTAIYNPEALGNAWWVEQMTYVDGADAEMDALDLLNPATQAVADRRFEKILGQGRPLAPGDTIYATSYAPNRITYHATTHEGGVAVFSEVYFPWGWNVTIDGKEAELGRVNYLLRALAVPAGSHMIEMTFNPASLHNTTVAAYIAIILIYIALAAAIATTIIRYRQEQTLQA